MRKVISTDRAPGAVGPYSQAVVAAGCVWISGQIPLDPATGEMVEGEIELQTERVMANLKAILEAAGSGLDQVIKCTVYLVDMNDFQRVNGVYAKSFPDDPPARVCIAARGLPKGARVEIDAVAELS